MESYVLKNKGWVVPDFEFTAFNGKSAKYCLIIPVINEGERIRNQLRKLKSYVGLLDVIMADGGSTDGSLEEDFLKDSGVNSLLVKKGDGRLSAQMRMGLAYAVERGYDGFVFMDGNDKDDPSALPLFLKALDDGFDHIQGSRFISGGRAVNTPILRYLSVRLIHAPVISFFSRKWQTDTTNGFRAYSKRLILDREVSVFRDVFRTYSLHYYLSVRSSRLGYILTEVPVSRAYPKNVKTPTKIHPFKGYPSLLFILFKVCLGLYNPRK